jgi:predicted nuclease of predicted toxin-antitoxin system
MNFLADENIFVPMVEALRKLGYDVFDIKEQQLIGTDDPVIYEMAVKRNRVLLTMDKDFSNIIKYPPGNHPGIIVLKLYKLPVSTATKIFMDSFQNLNNSDIIGNTVIIDKNKTRIRRKKNNA